MENEMSGPPYHSTTAALGGLPSTSLDVPITSVYLLLFLGAAVGHMTIFQLNKKKGHKFILSGMMFGFCMARITTCVMRIVWSQYPTNVRVALAASIFVAAGVVLLFVINLIFAQRLVRAKHPAIGWHPAFSIAFKAIYVLIVFILAMVITSVVQNAYTLNPNTKNIDRYVLLSGGAFYTLIAFLPIPLVLTALIIPAKTKLDHFGAGRWRTKVMVLLTGAFLLCLGASFRTGTGFKTPRPIEDPAWYQSKACFYIFDLGVEIVTIYLYLIMRVDQRYHVPDGSKPYKSYSGQRDTEAAVDAESDAEEQKPRPSTGSEKDDYIGEEVTDDKEKEDLK